MNLKINIAVVDDEEEVFEIFNMYFKKEIRAEKCKLFFFFMGIFL